MGDDDVGGRHLQRLRQLAAQGKNALCMAPDVQLALLPMRHRARRADGGVRLERAGEGCLERLDRRGCRFALLAHHGVLRGLPPEVVEQLAARRRQRRRLLPFRALAQRPRRRDGLLFALGGDGEKAAIADDGDDARHGPRGPLVHRGETRPRRGRPDDAAEQHAGKAHVVHVGHAARHLGGNVAARDALADEAVLGSGLGLRLGRGLAFEHRVRGELPIGGAGAAGREDDAVLDSQGRHLCAELRGGRLQQDAACLGAGETQRRSRFFDRAAARGDAFVRGARGVARNHVDAREIDLELVADDLGERGHDPLADLHLAGERGHGAVRVDTQPAVEHAIFLQASRQRRRRLGEPASERREREAHSECCGLFEKAAPRDALELAGAHGDISFAARWIARTIRLCVPQRQRLPASACRISGSVGCGVSSSSALADISMPEMQYPHCAACSSMKAFWSGCRLLADPRPSSVVIFVSTTARAGVTQERTGFPSTSTVQAPHCAMPQPNLAALSSRSLRRTYSKGVSGAAATVRRRPLTVSVTAIVFPPWSGPGSVRAWRNCRRTLAEIRRIEYLAVGGRRGAGSRAPPRGPRGTWRAMRIVLAGFGTRGDVQPMVALAQALSDRGHSCSVFVPPNIAEWVTSFGLDTTPVGMDYEKLSHAVSTGRLLDILGALPDLRAEVARQGEAIEAAASQADVIVGASVLAAGSSLAERFGIPYVFFAFSPSLIPS